MTPEFSNFIPYLCRASDPFSAVNLIEEHLSDLRGHQQFRNELKNLIYLIQIGSFSNASNISERRELKEDVVPVLIQEGILLEEILETLAIRDPEGTEYAPE